MHFKQCLWKDSKKPINDCIKTQSAQCVWWGKLSTEQLVTKQGYCGVQPPWFQCLSTYYSPTHSVTAIAYNVAYMCHQIVDHCNHWVIKRNINPLLQTAHLDLPLFNNFSSIKKESFSCNHHQSHYFYSQQFWCTCAGLGIPADTPVYVTDAYSCLRSVEPCYCLVDVPCPLYTQMRKSKD